MDYAVTNDLFKGTSSFTFTPEASITRSQFVQVLANLEGVDTSDFNVTTPFSDVPRGAWFAPAIKWASENGIVNGVGGDRFAPDTPITREQMCVMLIRYATFKNHTLPQSGEGERFADDAKIADWSKAAVYACRNAGLVNGVGENRFDPLGTATRAQAATIFSRFHQSF